MKNHPRKQTGKATILFLALIAALTTTVCLAQKAENTASTVTSSVAMSSSKLSVIKDFDSWKWPGSGETKPEILYDQIPLIETVKDLREMFKHQFDVLLPSDLVVPKLNKDVQAVTVNLRLKNVTAAEIFNAMNLYFEIQKLPLRWELTMNGHRATAVLDVREEPKRQEASPAEKQHAVERSVIYVGDLVGDEKLGWMTMDRIAETLMVTYQMSYGSPVNRRLVQCHAGAELVVVTGTEDEITFIRSTIDALKQKVTNDRLRKAGQPETAPSPNLPASNKKPQ